jgi:hypothetical protein
LKKSAGSPYDQIPVEVLGQEPRNVDQMQDFGQRLSEFEDTEAPVMTLDQLNGNPTRSNFVRQSDTSAPADDDEIRCIPKVMQVHKKITIIFIFILDIIPPNLARRHDFLMLPRRPQLTSHLRHLRRQVHDVLHVTGVVFKLCYLAHRGAMCNFFWLNF